jgi:hypothetical protein
MKSLKIISLVALLAPSFSFAEGTAATHPENKPSETAPAATPSPTAEHAVQPTASVEEKTDKKAFCAKNKEAAAAQCNKWLAGQKKSHKEKLVESKCSEAAAATEADKCKTGSQVSHGEVKFHK